MFRTSGVEGELIIASKRIYKQTTKKIEIDERTVDAVLDFDKRQIEQNEIEIIKLNHIAFLDQMDLEASVDLAQLENGEILVEDMLSEEETGSEMRIFLKRMEEEAKRENQELEHYFASERELQDQIELEVLDKEQYILRSDGQ